MGFTMVFPYIPLYAKDIGIPIAVSGYVLATFYLIQGSVLLPAGHLSDRGYQTNVILLGSLSLIVASFFCLLSKGFWVFLFFSLLFLAIGMTANWVTIPSLITQDSSHLPIYTSCTGGGMLMGPLIGGVIREYYGMFYVFILFLFFAFILTILAFIFRKRFSRDSSTLVSRENSLSILGSSFLQSFPKAFHLLKENKKVIIASLFTLVFISSFAAGQSLFPLHLSEIGFTSFKIGILLSIIGCLSAFTRLITGRILERGDKEVFLSISLAVVGLAILGISISTSFTILVLLAIAWGFGGGFYLPLVYKLIAEGTQKRDRATAMGLRTMIGTLGSALVVIIFMNFAEISTIQTSMIAVGTVIVLLVGIIWLYWKIG